MQLRSVSAATLTILLSMKPSGLSLCKLQSIANAPLVSANALLESTAHEVAKVRMPTAAPAAGVSDVLAVAESPAAKGVAAKSLEAPCSNPQAPSRSRREGASAAVDRAECEGRHGKGTPSKMAGREPKVGTELTGEESMGAFWCAHALKHAVALAHVLVTLGLQLPQPSTRACNQSSTVQSDDDSSVLTLLSGWRGGQGGTAQMGTVPGKEWRVGGASRAQEGADTFPHVPCAPQQGAYPALEESQELEVVRQYQSEGFPKSEVTQQGTGTSCLSVAAETARERPGAVHASTEPLTLARHCTTQRRGHRSSKSSRADLARAGCGSLPLDASSCDKNSLAIPADVAACTKHDGGERMLGAASGSSPDGKSCAGDGLGLGTLGCSSDSGEREPIATCRIQAGDQKTQGVCHGSGEGNMIADGRMDAVASVSGAQSCGSLPQEVACIVGGVSGLSDAQVGAAMESGKASLDSEHNQRERSSIADVTAAGADAEPISIRGCTNAEHEAAVSEGCEGSRDTKILLKHFPMPSVDRCPTVHFSEATPEGPRSPRGAPSNGIRQEPVGSIGTTALQPDTSMDSLHSLPSLARWASLSLSRSISFGQFKRSTPDTAPPIVDTKAAFASADSESAGCTSSRRTLDPTSSPLSITDVDGTLPDLAASMQREMDIGGLAPAHNWGALELLFPISGLEEGECSAPASAGNGSRQESVATAGTDACSDVDFAASLRAAAATTMLDAHFCLEMPEGLLDALYSILVWSAWRAGAPMRSLSLLACSLVHTPLQF
jgi:hypothetical protein